MKMRLARRLGLGALISLGLLESLGYLLGVPTLTYIGRISGASPFADVFTEFNGFAYWATSTTVDVKKADGTLLQWDKRHRKLERMGYHHLTQMVHSLPMVSARIFPQAAIGMLTKPFFCDSESLLLRRHGASGEKIQSYRITIMPKTRDRKISSHEFRCDE